MSRTNIVWEAAPRPLLLTVYTLVNITWPSGIMLPITPNDTLVSDHNLESGENTRV